MDQKTLYTRALSTDFLHWLNENKLLKTIKSNPLLNIGMRGNKIIIYYRGAKILTITDRIISNPKNQLIQLDSKYIGTESICPPTLDNIQEYLNKAICAVNNSGKVVAEQEIRQTIAYANNLSANANDTDYFIVDQEYSAPSSSGKNCKFDMVALRWPSKKEARRSPNIKDFEIVIFELKHGINAVGSSSKAQMEKLPISKAIWKILNHSSAMTAYAINSNATFYRCSDNSAFWKMDFSAPGKCTNTKKSKA